MCELFEGLSECVTMCGCETMVFGGLTRCETIRGVWGLIECVAMCGGRPYEVFDSVWLCVVRDHYEVFGV